MRWERPVGGRIQCAHARVSLGAVRVEARRGSINVTLPDELLSVGAKQHS